MLQEEAMKKESIEELTNLINITAKATVTHPSEYRLVQKRIRSRVRNHQKRGILPSGDLMDPAIYFSWAIHTAGYTGIFKLKDLPKRPVTGKVLASEAGNNAQSVGTVIPGDHDTLKRQYELLSLEKREIEAIAAHAKIIEAELAALKKKEEDTREKKRSAGKRGGRGKIIY